METYKHLFQIFGVVGVQINIASLVALSCVARMTFLWVAPLVPLFGRLCSLCAMELLRRLHGHHPLEMLRALLNMYHPQPAQPVVLLTAQIFLVPLPRKLIQLSIILCQLFWLMAPLQLL